METPVNHYLETHCSCGRCGNHNGCSAAARTEKNIDLSSLPRERLLQVAQRMTQSNTTQLSDVVAAAQQNKQRDLADWKRWLTENRGDLEQ